MLVCLQEARLEECERMLVAIDLALWLNDGISALQAVVICYGLLTPLVFHQVKYRPIVEVKMYNMHLSSRYIIMSYLNTKVNFD